MGNAAIYYYPDPAGTLETIDLGQPLTELEEIPERQIAQGVSLMGYSSTHVYSGTMRVRVVLADVQTTTSAGQTLHRSLSTLSAHLERGGLVGVTADTAKAWASYVSKGRINRGDTAFVCPVNQWYTRSSVSALSSGDELVLESDNPEMLREYTTIDTASASNPTFTPAAKYTFASRTYARWRNFYPALYWPEQERGRSIIVSERRTRFTLDMTLAVEWAVMAGVALNLGITKEGTAGSGISIDNIQTSTKEYATGALGGRLTFTRSPRSRSS